VQNLICCYKKIKIPPSIHNLNKQLNVPLKVDMPSGKGRRNKRKELKNYQN
jgi:hypothetical protein